MTDGQTLFVVFAALYLLESLRWLPVRSVLCAGSGGRWRLLQPLSYAQGNGWGLVILPLLPPGDIHLVTLPWLLVPGDQGIAICDQEDGRPALVPWPELAPRREGATLFLNEVQRVRLPSQADAEAMRGVVERWLGMQPPEREHSFLEAAQRSLDPESLRLQAQGLAHDTRVLRWLSVLIFGWCFGVFAGVYWWLGDSLIVIGALGVLLLLQWAQAALFWRAARSHRVTVKHRFWKALAIAWLPHIAMRAPDVISKAVPATAHPLAARGLIDERRWLPLAARFWKAARYGSEDGVASLVSRALATFLREQEIDTDQLEPIPERQPGSAAFCPRCLAQFRDAGAVCGDCGGIALRQWPAEGA